jgi:hypothetical protein
MRCYPTLSRVRKDIEVDRAPSGGLIITGPGKESGDPVEVVVAGRHVVKARGVILRIRKVIDKRIQIADAHATAVLRYDP